MVILSMVVGKLLQRSPSLTALLTLQKAFSSQMSWSSTRHHVHNQADVIFGLGGREDHWLRIEAQELSMRHGLMSFPLFRKSEEWKLNNGMHSSVKTMNTKELSVNINDEHEMEFR